MLCSPKMLGSCQFPVCRSLSRSQTGFKNPKKPGPTTENRENRFVSVWVNCGLMPWARGTRNNFQAHKEAEAAAAAITITCFVINYSLRNAGDRPKTTTVTVTQGSRLAGWQEARLDHVLLLLLLPGLQRILLLEKKEFT